MTEKKKAKPTREQILKNQGRLGPFLAEIESILADAEKGIAEARRILN